MDFDLLAKLTLFQSDSLQNDIEESYDVTLNKATEYIAVSPEGIANDDAYDLLESLVLSVRDAPSKIQSQITYLVSSGLRNIKESCLQVLESSSLDTIGEYKIYLEAYSFLMYILLVRLTSLYEDQVKALTAKSTKKANDATRRLDSLLQISMESVCEVLKLHLSKMFVTTPERDTFISLFTKPLYLLMENELLVKNEPVKMYMFKILGMAVKFHGHTSAALISLTQGLTYFTHLSNVIAEFLEILCSQYDYPKLAEELLKEVSNKNFNPNDNNGPKSVALFMIRLSELIPRVVLKQMTLVALLLDNTSFTLRSAVIECCGNIVMELANDEAELERHQNQIDVLLDLMEQRFLDQNPFVRSRAIQSFIKLTSLEVKFVKRRLNLTALAVQSLEDKSSVVRKNSIKLLSRLVLTHPFALLHGDRLSLKEWETRLSATQARLSDLEGLTEKTDAVIEREVLDEVSVQVNGEADEELVDDEMNGSHCADGETSENEDSIHEDHNTSNAPAEESQNSDNNNHPDINELYKLKLTLQYETEAVQFINKIHEGAETIMKLLYSKYKPEVIESMDFFVLIDAYGVDVASQGIRKMLHLVWSKNSNDEGTNIVEHLLECYKALFLIVPEDLSSEIAEAAYIAKNLIALTYGASISELTSLERLLTLMRANALIPDNVIHVLWQIYNFQKKEFSKTQRRGAIIILGMIAFDDYKVALRGHESLLSIGLGPRGQVDLQLAKYSCIALQRIIDPEHKKRLPNGDNPTYIPNETATIEALANFIGMYHNNPEWFGVAEQAINAVYTLSSNPNSVMTRLIKLKTKQVFGNTRPKDVNQTINLAQLLFILGHTAIKTLVYLDLCETMFKKKKISSEATGNEEQSESQQAQNELEMIGATTEDDFADAVMFIKENEMLYGENSLFARFAPMVKNICENFERYPDEILQASASLCLAKFMCVSSRYCEENLPLLINIMETSENPAIRSNAVVGLGDMAVSFNNLVDENTDFLYQRLTDDNIMVQRTCLMTVTFLILAGQVKVKGQLSHMAKCLEDEDQRISDMCRLFFTELATKDNAIYNGFIDIFSGLSNDETVSKDTLKRITKFLLSFIEKERHQKQLMDKLMIRLSRCDDEAQWNDVAMVLSSLPCKTDEVSQVISEGFKMVAAK